MASLETEARRSINQPLAVAGRLFEDAYQGVTQTGAACGRESYLVASGLVGGAIKEIERDPLKAGLQLGVTAVAGTVLAAGAIAEAPAVVTGLALTVGAVATGKWFAGVIDPNRLDNQRRNKAVSQALADAWFNSDQVSLRKDELAMQANLGALGLDLGCTLFAGGVAARYAPSLTPDISAGSKALAGLGRSLSTKIADLTHPVPSHLFYGLRLAPEAALPVPGRAPAVSAFSEYVNFCERARNSEAVPTEKQPAFARKPQDQSDIEQVNRIQAELFPEDRLSEMSMLWKDDLIVLDQPGQGVVGYAWLGSLDEPTLLYMGVLPQYRAGSKFLIKAVLDSCRKEGCWWYSSLKEDTAFPLFRGLANDKYIRLKILDEPEVHPQTGKKYFHVKFKVTDKDFTGVRTSRKPVAGH